MNQPLPDSWLDDQANEAERAQREAKATEVSRLYMVFETHPVAKQLLEMWETACLNKRTPVDASIARYAADEAVRAFIAGIRHQIALAKQVPSNVP